MCKATSEHPDSPDLILHIELGAPPWGCRSTCDGSVAWLRHLGGVLHKRGIGQDSVFLTDCVQSLKSNQWEDFVWVRLGRILVETTGALSLPR